MFLGWVDNLVVVMGLYLDYFSSFWCLYYLLLYMDGFLVSFWCYYIVIMVVVCYQCFYLVGFYMIEFLQIGGDFEWLLGFYWVFEKFCKFSEVNKLLVYWLWFIIKEYIQVLLKIGEYSWFLVEFI